MLSPFRQPHEPTRSELRRLKRWLSLRVARPSYGLRHWPLLALVDLKCFGDPLSVEGSVRFAQERFWYRAIFDS